MTYSVSLCYLVSPDDPNPKQTDDYYVIDSNGKIVAGPCTKEKADKIANGLNRLNAKNALGKLPSQLSKIYREGKELSAEEAMSAVNNAIIKMQDDAADNKPVMR